MNKGLQAYLEAPHQADILVVDDTLENVVLLANILEEQGYEVRKAMNGTMARTAINTVLPDLILLNIFMPDIDGFTLCQELKADAVTAQITVIFLYL
jgi:PleD family two-component response regulator